MAEQSKMVALGSRPPDFTLSDAVSGRGVRPGDFADAPALLVAFLSNHCPCIEHLLDGFVSFAREYGPRGLAVVAICSNDALATDAVLHGRAPPSEQTASAGCSTKWRR